jgi:hypothetical protein
MLADACCLRGRAGERIGVWAHGLHRFFKFLVFRGISVIETPLGEIRADPFMEESIRPLKCR